MRAYEFLVVFKPDVPDEQLKAHVDKLQALVNEKGRVYAIEFWGKKKLAYEIQKFSKGFYFRFVMTADPAHIEELERVCRITGDIMRFLSVKLSDKPDEEALVEEFGADEPVFEIRSPESDRPSGSSSDSGGEKEAEKKSGAETSSGGGDTEDDAKDDGKDGDDDTSGEDEKDDSDGDDKSDDTSDDDKDDDDDNKED